MLREHGFQGLRMWQKGWLKAVTLPVNPNVDRSVCAEFQVLNELCDLVHQSGLSDNVEECCHVSGWAKVLVSTTPCLSCVCAVMQYSLLFPGVRLEFGCVQPWHSEGGADGAMNEVAWTGIGDTEMIRPAMWEGGHIITDPTNPPPEKVMTLSAPTEPDEQLPPGSLEVLQAKCQVKLGGGHVANIDLGEATSWRQVRTALECSTSNLLAEVLRGHRIAVKAETQPERVEKVLAFLRAAVSKELLDSMEQQVEEKEGNLVGTQRPSIPRHSSLGARRPKKNPVVRWRVGA